MLRPSKFNQYDVLHSRKGEYIRLQEEVNYPTAKGIIRLEHPRRLRWTLRVCLVRYGSLYTTQHVLWFAFIKEVKTLHNTKQQQHAFIPLWTYYHVTECRHGQKVREKVKVVGYGLCFMIIDDGLHLRKASTLQFFLQKIPCFLWFWQFLLKQWFYL